MNTRFDVRITRRSDETTDIASFELEHLDGSPLPPFDAGAHIDVVAPNGVVRQYSLCGRPSDHQRYVIGVLRDPQSRGASAAIHEQFAEGDIVNISAPRNHFELQPARRSILLAAGIGVTPLLCMAEQLTEAGADFELHYFARSRDRAAFLARIETSAFAERVVFHFDDETPVQRPNLSALLASPHPETHLYLCGPEGFLELGRSTATDQGWPSSQVHFENFRAPKQDNQETSAADGFEIKVVSTGKVYQIPADKSITSVLAEQGVVIPVSCEEGVCGTCITGVLEGIPEHRDCYFSEEEKARNDQFMPCCSRSISPVLLLDL
jgi:vanillate O-demethylase ferredoxin subunit